jgi:hypothetical protein
MPTMKTDREQAGFRGLVRSCMDFHGGATPCQGGPDAICLSGSCSSKDVSETD